MDFLVTFLFAFIICISSSTNAAHKCQDMLTCSTCIQEDVQCAWCEDENLGVSRCNALSFWQTAKPCKSLQNPQKRFQKIKDFPLSNPKASIDNLVQLAPQEVAINLRPGEPYKLRLHFRQAADYPVDLYYIMDLSYSMNVHKDKLASLGDQLAVAMSETTKNFRLGFGAFVDKVALPYVSTVPEKLESPCFYDGVKCAPPFGFKNVMPLSEETRKFKTLVSGSKMSGNIDTPEGGLDALMQAVVCEKPIAWRNISRKLVVLSTDAGYHIAGDGKLAGIVKPNDGHCYLNNIGEYTEDTKQDYPSIGHLNAVVSEKKVHIIFAVTGNMIPTYKLLADRLEGAGIGQLDFDSKNVVKLIKDHYDKISSTLILKDNAPSDVRMTYYTQCLDTQGKWKKNNTCENIKVGTNVHFDVEIDVKRCPKDKSEWSKTVQIGPQGIDESVLVHLNLICECDCESSKTPNSDKCAHGNGTYVCGICSCNPKRYGSRCECGVTDTAATKDEEACYMNNGSLVCSGVGQCICGMCDCSMTLTGSWPRSGKFCECEDDVSLCPASNNGPCSGNGRCVCGECECDPGWKGKECDCTESAETCMPPDGQEICSGNGECRCGLCECKLTEEGSYIGKYCEECPKCDGKCEAHWPCVTCHEKFHDTQQDICLDFNCSSLVTIVDKLEVKPTERFCKKQNRAGCEIRYTYSRNQHDEYYIIAKSPPDCPDAAPVAIIAGSVIAGVVALGIAALLIWKILTSMHDKREYARFENERQAARWDKSENPLYKPSTTMFSNPTYPQQ